MTHSQKAWLLLRPVTPGPGGGEAGMLGLGVDSKVPERGWWAACHLHPAASVMLGPKADALRPWEGARP